MALTEVVLHGGSVTVPEDVRAFLREAERRIDEFQRSVRVPGFVPSNFEKSYQVLRGLTDANLTRGNLFCEWGSGFGVVACLAAMLDFDAIGIEIEADLVEEARSLAADFDLPVEFALGSFIPRGWKVPIDDHDGFAWLSTDGNCANEELGLDTDDFDVIFAYPWPDEEDITQTLFERFAGHDAVLITYHGSEDFRVRRQKRKKRST